jgi:hypothetical protein
MFGKTTGTPIPTGNLVRYYKLNADANDSVGTAHGTATAITYTSGKTGNAATFDSTTSSKISLPANIWSSPTEVSVSGFFKATNTTSEYRFISLNNNGVNSPFVLGRFNNTTAGRIGSIVSPSTEIITDAETITNWNHIIITSKETGSTIIYIDGVQVATTAGAAFSQVGTLGNYLGSNRAGIANFLSGQMFGVGMWDKQLSAAEALAVFEKQDSGSHLV